MPGGGGHLHSVGEHQLAELGPGHVRHVGSVVTEQVTRHEERALVRVQHGVQQERVVGRPAGKGTRGLA